MGKKSKKIIWLLLCVMIVSIFATGCGVVQDNKIKVISTNRANLSMSIGMDDETLEAYAELLEITGDEFISRVKENGATYSTQRIDGVKYHMFTDTQNGLRLSEIEDVLEEMGYENVCLTRDYFHARYVASEVDIDEMLGDDPDLTSEQIRQLKNMTYIQSFSVQLKDRVRTTNGKIDKSNNKLVTWTYKSSDKSKNFYATTSPTTKTARTESVKNNRTYKTSVKILVSNSYNIVRMTLDGKVIKSGKIVNTKGHHELIIWSKDGKCQRVGFTVK